MNFKTYILAVSTITVLVVMSGCHERTIERIQRAREGPKCMAVLDDNGITMPEGYEFLRYRDYGTDTVMEEWASDFYGYFRYRLTVEELTLVFIESLKDGDYSVYKSTQPPYTHPSALVAGYKDGIFVKFKIWEQLPAYYTVDVDLYRMRDDKEYELLKEGWHLEPV